MSSAGSKIYISDINGLYTTIDNMSILIDQIIKGPFTFVTGVVADGLSVGYPSQIDDPMYKIDFNQNVRIKKKAYIEQELQVDQLTRLNASCIIGGRLIVNSETYLNSTLSVLENTSLKQTLDVAGNTYLDSDLFVKSDSLLQGKLTVMGDTNLNKNLNVNENTLLNGYLYVNGSTKFQNNVFVAGDTFLEKDLYVTKNTEITGEVVVKGKTIFQNNVSVLGDTSLNQNLEVYGNTSIGTNLFVRGNSLFQDQISVLENTFLDKNLDVTGDSILQGKLIVMGDTDLNKNLIVNEDTQLNGYLYVNGSTKFKNNVSVAGDTFLEKDLYVTKNTEITGELYVTDKSIFQNNVSVLGDTSLNQHLEVSGNTSIGTNLFVRGNSLFQDQLSVLENTFLDKNLDVTGDSIFQGNVSVFGNTSLQNNLNVYKNTSIGGVLYVNGSTSFQDNLEVFGNTYMNNTLNVIGDTSINGFVTINNSTNLSSLRVYGKTVLYNTTIGGGLLEVDAPRVIYKGNISMIGATTLGIDGTLKVTDLYYKKLINDPTEANLYTGQNSINRLEIRDFIDPEGNAEKNLSGWLLCNTNVIFSNLTENKALQIGALELPLTVTSYTKDDSYQSFNGQLDINASSSEIGKFDYSGFVVFRGTEFNIKSTAFNISSVTTFGNTVSLFKDFNIKPNTKVSIETAINISNSGTGPALRVGQLNPSFSEIMLLESSGLDVYSVGQLGNTQIRGKIRVGYDVLSSTGTNVSNVVGDREGINPFASYQLDVSGSCFITQDINVSRNMSINGETYFNGLLTLQGDITSYSDRRIKKNIRKLDDCLDKIKDIRGYSYQRIDRSDQRRSIGLIAQEVEDMFPEIVTDGDIKTVNYQAFTGVLLECIHELKERVSLLETKCLENKILN